MIYLFDLGGVLYRIRPEYFQKKLLASLDSPQKRLQIQRDNVFDDYQKGKLSSPEFLSYLQKNYYPHLSPEEITEIWNSILAGNFPFSEKIIRKLKKQGHLLYLLSNTNALHYEALYPEAKTFLKFFDKIFLSYEMGLAKPQTEIFLEVIKFIKTSPKKIIFLDDSPENIEAAKRIGMQTQLITSQRLLTNYFSDLI